MKKQHQMNQRSRRPMLRFSPTAWAKLVYLRDLTCNEVGGFGICDADDLLFVRDIAVVKQTVSIVTVAFDDNAVADYFEDQVIAGRRPEQFARIWIHCHPGNDPEPSGTDEETFKRVFGPCDWSVMAIVAQDGSSYARLRFTAGPGGDINVPVCVDYNCAFGAADPTQWKAEYLANVKENSRFSPKADNGKESEIEAFGYDESQVCSGVSYEDMLMELDTMDPDERQMYLDELAEDLDYYDREEVFYE